MHASFGIIIHENDVGVMVCYNVFSYVTFTLDVIFSDKSNHKGSKFMFQDQKLG